MAIDTRMNGIIHAALRRDLDRTAMVLDGPDPVSDTRLRAIGTHVVWLMDLLHSHHTTEDERLFPVIRRNNPATAALLDEMETEHAAIAGAVTTLDAAGRRAEAGMLDNLDPAGVSVVTSAVPAVRRFLMLRLLGGPYRRRREACWGSTPAAAVPATPASF